MHIRLELTMGLILIGVTITLNAQTWSGATPGNIYYNSGSVGIGITNPESVLDIYSPINSTLKIRNESYTNGYTEMRIENKRYASPGNQAGLIANSSGSELYGIPTSTFGIYSIWRPIVFAVGNGSGNTFEYMRLDQFGNLGIGTTSPDYKLTVNGKIKAEEIQVVVDVPADYVFKNDYLLQPLEEVEKFIEINRHLPGIPSAERLKSEGWQVGEMNNKLLEKIEEITLYLIEMKKENEALRSELKQLKNSLK